MLTLNFESLSNHCPFTHCTDTRPLPNYHTMDFGLVAQLLGCTGLDPAWTGLDISQTTIDSLQPAVCCLLSAVFRQLSAVCCLLPAITNHHFTVNISISLPSALDLTLSMFVKIEGVYSPWYSIGAPLTEKIPYGPY